MNVIRQVINCKWVIEFAPYTWILTNAIQLLRIIVCEYGLIAIPAICILSYQRVSAATKKIDSCVSSFSFYNQSWSKMKRRKGSRCMYVMGQLQDKKLDYLSVGIFPFSSPISLKYLGTMGTTRSKLYQNAKKDELKLKMIC